MDWHATDCMRDAHLENTLQVRERLQTTPARVYMLAFGPVLVSKRPRHEVHPLAFAS